MPHSILAVEPPCDSIHQRIGMVASEFSWVEMLLAEMLAYLCSAEPGQMYVITQSTSTATMTGWIRTLTKLRFNEASADVICGVLTEIDDARAERNTVVHGQWRAAEEVGFGHVQTFNWERKEVVRDELWSVADLDGLIQHLQLLQLQLGNLGLKLGFLKNEHVPGAT